MSIYPPRHLIPRKAPPLSRTDAEIQDDANSWVVASSTEGRAMRSVIGSLMPRALLSLAWVLWVLEQGPPRTATLIAATDTLQVCQKAAERQAAVDEK